MKRIRQEKRLLVGLLAVILVLLPCMSHAAIPQKINYQGYLTNGAGVPVNGTVQIVFSIYNVPSGGTDLWTETQNVTVTRGVYNVELGDVTPIPLPFDVPYYLGIKVGADPEMTPRMPLTSVGYAFRALTADNAGTGTITGVTAGTGLTGGGASGGVTLSVLPPYLLPQSCVSGQIPSWNGSAWVCASDQNSGGTVTGVTAGTGLTGGGTLGSVTLSVLPPYRLPQSCNSGEIPSWNGSTWVCASDQNSGGTVTGVTAGAGLTGGGTSGNVTLNANLAGTGSAMTVARSDHNHNATYVSVTGGTMTGALNVPSLVAPQISTNPPGTNLSISAANGTGNGGDVTITAGQAGNSSGGGGGDVIITAGYNMPIGGMGYSGLGPAGVVSITAGGGYNSVGGNVTIQSGPTSSWAPGNSSSRVSIRGGTMDGAISGGAIEVEGGHSVSGGTTVSAGGNVSLNGGNANGSYPGGSIILTGGTGSTGGGIILRTNGTKPPCSSGNRGMLWYTEGGMGAKDSLEICAKDATDTYGWQGLW